jgi:hypothetical protein
VAALGPPPREHRAAILALHSRPEAMRFGALAIVRLKRSFGHCLVSALTPAGGAQPIRV